MSFGWLLPLLVTIAAFVRAFLVFRRQASAQGLLGPFNVIIAMVLLVIASAISLAAWLAYFMWLVLG
jgi:hypothetical protein